MSEQAEQQPMGPLEQLIRAIRTIEGIVHTYRWRAFDSVGVSGLKLYNVERAILTYEVRLHKTEQYSTVLDLNYAVATILNTALEMASLAHINERLAHRAMTVTVEKTALEEVFQQQARTLEDQQATITDQAREIGMLRYALAAGGIGAVAECPSCKAERTNGENHADDCALMMAARAHAEERSESNR